MTKTLDAASRTSSARVDPTVGFRRVAGALALPAAFTLQLGMNTIYAWVTLEGGGDTGVGEETLAFHAVHGQSMLIASTLALLGSLLVVPGVLAALRVLRPTRPRLSLVAGVLMIAGYIAYFGIVFTNFVTISLAAALPDAGAVLDAAHASPFVVLFFLLFVVGNLVGTLLLGLAVILSRALPWWAGVLIIGWPVGHVINIVVVNEWFAVVGGVFEVIGLSVVAAAALRTSNGEWSRRG